MADEIATGDEGRGRIGLLDVHVEQIAEELDVVKALATEERGRVADLREEVCLVAVERLIEERLPAPCRMPAEVMEGRGKVLERVDPRHIPLVAPLHRSDDHRRSQIGRVIDEQLDEVAGLGADARVGMSERKLVPHPPRAAPHGGQAQPVVGESPGQAAVGELLWPRRKHLHRVEAEFRRPSAADIKCLRRRGPMKHERPLPRLTHEAHRHGALHATGPRCGANSGRRCRS